MKIRLLFKNNVLDNFFFVTHPFTSSITFLLNQLNLLTGVLGVGIICCLWLKNDIGDQEFFFSDLVNTVNLGLRGGFDFCLPFDGSFRGELANSMDARLGGKIKLFAICASILSNCSHNKLTACS